MRPDDRDFDEEIRGHLAISVKERIDRGEDLGFECGVERPRGVRGVHGVVLLGRCAQDSSAGRLLPTA